MILLTRRGALAAGLALASSSARAQPMPRIGGTLRLSVDQAPEILNPLVARGGSEYLVSDLLYSGLTRLAPDTSATPDLAMSWSANPDGTEWTFNLRPGVQFHDRSPCTARDVAATFTAILDPKTASPARLRIGPIGEVQAADDRTVVFGLHAPYAGLPVALTHPNAKIIPAPIAAGGLERLFRAAIGTGPFKLKEQEPGRRTLVTRNKAYFNAPRPYLDRVELLVHPDPAAATAALLSGEIDLIPTVAPADFAGLTTAPTAVALRVPSGQFLSIVMRCDQPPWNDVRVRQALALTLDREALVGLVAEGYGTPGNDAPLNAAYRFAGHMPLRAPDAGRARQLLTEAGHPNGLEAILIVSDQPSARARLANAVRDMAKPAGFRIEVQTVPHATYLDEVWKKRAFYVRSHDAQATADAVFSLYYTSEGDSNETRWNNAAFDQLVADARATVDDAKRAALYAQLQALMHEQVPSVIPLFFDRLAARRNWVQDCLLHPRGAMFHLDEAWFNGDAPRRS